MTTKTGCTACDDARATYEATRDDKTEDEAVDTLAFSFISGIAHAMAIAGTGRPMPLCAPCSHVMRELTKAAGVTAVVEQKMRAPTGDPS